MRARDIKPGAFYVLRSGETVRVAPPAAAVTIGELTRSRKIPVWERDGQEPFEVNARDLVREVPDPTTKAAFLADMAEKDPRGLNLAIQAHRAKIEAMTEEQFQAHRAALRARFSTPEVKATAQRLAREVTRGH